MFFILELKRNYPCLPVRFKKLHFLVSSTRQLAFKQGEVFIL